MGKLVDFNELLREIENENISATDKKILIQKLIKLKQVNKKVINNCNYKIFHRVCSLCGYEEVSYEKGKVKEKIHG